MEYSSLGNYKKDISNSGESWPAPIRGLLPSQSQIRVESQAGRMWDHHHDAGIQYFAAIKKASRLNSTANTSKTKRHNYIKLGVH